MRLSARLAADMNEMDSLGGMDDKAGDMLWVLFVLIVIIGCIVVFLKFLSQKNKTWMSDGSMTIISSVGLGQNKSLQLIEMGNALYLIGVGNDVRLIHCIDDPGQIQMIKDSMRSRRQQGTAWLPGAIAAWFGKDRKQANDMEADQATLRFDDLLQMQTKQMSKRNDLVEELLRQKPSSKTAKRDDDEY